MAESPSKPFGQAALPHLRFDVERCIDNALEVNPELTIVQVSAQTGEGMDRWYEWLSVQLRWPASRLA